MAGHSKWANMKHRKERADKKKAKIFSRLVKEIISAVKQGGSDPKINSKLRVAIEKAKIANVPSDNIEKNIKKASSADQQDYRELTYELYGFGGVGILVEILTDNPNRISSEIHIATNKKGGTIAVPGAVSYNFERKGIFRIAKEAVGEDSLFLLVTDAGAEDFSSKEGLYQIVTSLEGFAKVKEALEREKIRCEEATFEYLPKIFVEVSDEDADQNIALIEWLENLDDVDGVFHNMSL
jgi:YebC/PmpR family DNA-binding regulatory protein